MFRIILMLSGLLGSTGMALCAYAAHGLTGVTAEQLDIFKAAALYQVIHAIALLGIAILIHLFPSRLLNLAGGLMAAGIIIFSGSLYLLSFFGTKVMFTTPIGGIALITGWLCLYICAMQLPAKSQTN